MILKAGTYRFNDVLNLTDLPYDNGYYNVNVNCTFPQLEGYVGTQFNFVYRGGSLYEMGYTIQGIYEVVWVFANGQENYEAATHFDNVWHTLTEFGIPEGATKYVAFTRDIEVDDTFGEWFIASTNYNEVNASPIATITYNGQTIAQLNAGESATLSCDEKRMTTDVTVKIGDIPEPNLEAVTVEALPDAQIVYPSGDVVGFSQVNVVAKSPLPIEAANATLMAMYLESAEVGSVYKYTGETTDTYENGALYVVVAEDT